MMTSTLVRPFSIGVVGTLAGLSIGWAFSGLRPLSAEPAARESSTLHVQESATGSQVVYVLDRAEQTLCVYQFDPAKGKIKLSAVRHLTADRQLLEFNNEEPHVADIEKLARSKE
jgi:hypothetical protein